MRGNRVLSRTVTWRLPTRITSPGCTRIPTCASAPLTLTLPARINSSISRRDPSPACASTLWIFCGPLESNPSAGSEACTGGCRFAPASRGLPVGRAGVRPVCWGRRSREALGLGMRVWRARRCYTSRRSSTAWASVPLSTYSSSPPTGRPRAMRVTFSPLARSSSPI